MKITLNTILIVGLTIISLNTFAVMPPWKWDNQQTGHHLSPPTAEQLYLQAVDVVKNTPMPSLNSYDSFYNLTNANQVVKKLNDFAEILMASYPLDLHQKLRKMYYGTEQIISTRTHEIFSEINSSVLGPYEDQIILSRTLNELPILERIAKIKLIIIELGVKLSYFENVSETLYYHQQAQVLKVAKYKSWLIEKVLLDMIPDHFIENEIKSAKLPSDIIQEVFSEINLLKEQNHYGYFHNQIIYNYPEDILSKHTVGLWDLISTKFNSASKFTNLKKHKIELFEHSLITYYQNLMNSGDLETNKIMQLTNNARKNGDQLMYRVYKKVLADHSKTTCTNAGLRLISK